MNFHQILLYFLLIFIGYNSTNQEPKFQLVEEEPIGSELVNLTNYLFNYLFSHPGNISIFKSNQLSRCLKVDNSQKRRRIIISDRIDRETLCKQMIKKCNFTIKFSIMSFSELIPVTIELLDINDNVPRFPNKAEIVRIWENPIKTDEILNGDLAWFYDEKRRKRKDFRVPGAIDPDIGRNGELSYYLDSMKNEKGLPLFKLVEPIEPKAKSIEIVTTSKIDNENRSQYELILRAVDNGLNHKLTGTLTIVVLVIDLNEHKPKFTRQLFENLTVSETTKIGDVVLQLNATDLDPGKNGMIRYDFHDKNLTNADDYFSLSRDGKLSVIKKLDYDRDVDNRQFHFKVVAIDTPLANFEKTDTATVKIVLKDENDEAPDIIVHIKQREPPVGGFSMTEDDQRVIDVDMKNNERRANNFVQIIWENDERNEYVLAYFQITDLDFNGHDQVHCTINKTSSKMNNKVQLTQYLDQRIDLVKTSRTDYKLIATQPSFDRELFTDFKLFIQCQDAAFNTQKKQLKFRVLDDNDNDPVFEKSLYKFEVRENSTLIMLVGHISASDADSGRNCQLKYRLMGYGHDNFVVNKHGKMTTTRVLDRELMDSYSLAVLAIDGGSPARTGTSSIFVRVLDINDWAPHFSKSLYYFSIHENKPMNTIVGQIEAFDRDHHTTTARLYYKLLPSFNMPVSQFRINSKGEIKTNTKLNRETKNNFTFFVIASDSPYPGSGHSSSCTVSVTVLDENDNPPYFITKNYTTFKLNIQSPPGELIGRVEAKDLDDSLHESGNGKVEYILFSWKKITKPDMRLSNYGRQLFKLDPTTGYLFLGQYPPPPTTSSAINYRKYIIGNYRVTIQICDYGQPKLCSPTLLFLNIIITDHIRSSGSLQTGGGGAADSDQDIDPIDNTASQTTNKLSIGAMSDSNTFILIICVLVILLLFVILCICCLVFMRDNRNFRNFLSFFHNRNNSNNNNNQNNNNNIINTRRQHSNHIPGITTTGTINNNTLTSSMHRNTNPFQNSSYPNEPSLVPLQSPQYNQIGSGHSDDQLPQNQFHFDENAIQQSLCNSPHAFQFPRQHSASHHYYYPHSRVRGGTGFGYSLQRQRTLPPANQNTMPLIMTNRNPSPNSLINFQTPPPQRFTDYIAPNSLRDFHSLKKPKASYV